MITLDFPNAINNPERFYGRQRELNLIRQALGASRRVPVVVIGERRIGKTSIQNVAMHDLKVSNGGQIVPLIVEPRGIVSVDQFVESALSRLAMWARKDLRETGLVDSGNHVHLDNPAQLDHAFQRLLAGHTGIYFLLCVDEFDEMIRTAADAGPTERLKLMALVHYLVEKTELPLGLFFTMTRLPDTAGQEDSSPLLAKSEVVELFPLSLLEIGEMVRGLLQDEAVFAPADLSWLYEISGGHPYLTKLLLSNLFRRYPVINPPMQISRAMLIKALNDAVDDLPANHALENIYRVHMNADEKRVLLYLAERDEPVEAGELRASGISLLAAARSLEKRHYLAEQEGNYNFQSQFLASWLRNWVEFDEEIERLHVHRMVNPYISGETAGLTDDEFRR